MKIATTADHVCGAMAKSVSSAITPVNGKPRDRASARAFAMGTIFRSLPGAGAAFAPRLLVAFGSDRSRYRDPAELQKHAGIAPVRERSGRQIWIHWRWNAPGFLRQTFVEWAGESVVFCAWAKAYYFRQKRAGKRHQAILRALAFK